MNELPIKGQAAFLNRFGMTEEEVGSNYNLFCMQCGRRYGNHSGANTTEDIGGRVTPNEAECICPEDKT